MTLNALILSGRGRYADPWHPFEETSARLSDALTGLGFTTSVAQDVDRAMGDLVSGRPDLLVLNIGNPQEAANEEVLAEGRRGFLSYMDAGLPLLAMHSTSTSLPQLPEFPGILGGLWVRGTTFHPPYGQVDVHVLNDLDTCVSDFSVADEAYSDLATFPGNELIATHIRNGLEHPLIWRRTRPSGSRVVYDALGHDPSTYDSTDHRALLSGAIRWLTDDA